MLRPAGASRPGACVSKVLAERRRLGEVTMVREMVTYLQTALAVSLATNVMLVALTLAVLRMPAGKDQEGERR
jgi:hypothetical protein